MCGVVCTRDKGTNANVAEQDEHAHAHLLKDVLVRTELPRANVDDGWVVEKLACKTPHFLRPSRSEEKSLPLLWQVPDADACVDKRK